MALLLDSPHKLRGPWTPCAGWVTEGEAAFGEMSGSAPVSIHQQALRGIALVALERGDRGAAMAQVGGWAGRLVAGGQAGGPELWCQKENRACECGHRQVWLSSPHFVLPGCSMSAFWARQLWGGAPRSTGRMLTTAGCCTRRETCRWDACFCLAFLGVACLHTWESCIALFFGPRLDSCCHLAVARMLCRVLASSWSRR